MPGQGDKGGLPRPYTLGTFQKKLNDFEDFIRQITYQEVEATPEERRQMITENLRYDQFCDSIRELFGGDIRSQDLKALYRKISTNPDAKVDWSELFGYFQTEGEEQELSVGEDVNVFTISARSRVGDAAGDRKRRDVVQSMRYIPSLDCHLSASQKGAISVWSGKLRLQACTEINDTAWVTGCDYLPGIRRVAVTTERSINIWDSRAKGKNQQVFSIKPIEHSPQCMTWVPPITQGVHEDMILFGDDQGYINALTIAGKDLTMKSSKGDKRFTESYVIEPQKLTYPIKRKKVHNDWVLKIRYYHELRCFASCSPSSHKSFILEEVGKVFGEEKKDKKRLNHPLLSKDDEEPELKYMNVPKGVNAFDYCARANVIATGGVDKIIRVWHPHIFSRPTGKLIGHLFTIVDIVSNEKDQHIISLSTARVFRIWDIHTLTCLQVFTDNEDRPGEKRIYAMVFDNKHDRLLTGSSVIDAWPLTRAVQDTMQVPHTHDRPISQILYNEELNQMITVCTESVIRVWETDSGKQVYQIPQAHGSNIEVTAIALDKSGYRLASGAYDGSLKIWDFGSGQEIKWKTGKGEEHDFSVTGLQYCVVDGERCIIAAGWNNRIRLFLDSNDNYDLPVLRDFSDVHYLTREISLSSVSSFGKNRPLPGIGESESPGMAQVTNVFRKDYLLSSHEVTCVTSLLPNILVTGCNTGTVILRDIQKAMVDKVFHLPDPEPSSPVSGTSPSRLRQKQQQDKSVTAVRVMVHRVRRLDPAYIAKLTAQARRPLNEADDSDDETQGANRKVSRAHNPSQARSRTNSRVSNAEQKSAQEAGTAVNETEAVKEADDKEKSGDTEQGTNNAGEAEPDQQKEKVPVKEVRVVEAIENGEKKEGKEEEESSSDPDAHMIVDTFEPVLVSTHQDSFIRFWNMQGELLREISAVTRRQGSAVTAVSHDKDCNLLVTGDQKGYLTLWHVGKFLESPDSEEQDLVRQLVCWRAHLTKITQLAFVDGQKAIISGSTDGSVRIWWGTKGRFVGFYGQHRAFNFPTSEDTASTPVLPYDINEGPLAPVKSKSARQKIRAAQHYEYPLIFRNENWRPFRRSAYHAEMRTPREETDKKFFGALIKPRAYNTHLESCTTGEMRQGAVFRALPVYKVRTPPRPKTPEMSYPMTEEEEGNALFFTGFANAAKGVRTLTRLVAEAKAKTQKKSLNIPATYTSPTGRNSRTSAVAAVSPRRR